MPARASLAAKLAIAATTVLLMLGGAELAARAGGVVRPLGLIPGPENCLRRGALLSMAFRPHCTGELSNAPIRTNSLGLRGPEVSDDGRIRVLAIGDSCTFGWGVEEADSYPARLEAILNETDGPPRYRVINAGVPGYTSRQGLVYLRERGLALDPAIVVINYGFNDTLQSGDMEERLARAWLTTPLLTLDDALIHYSRFYGWMRWRSHQRAVVDQPAQVPPEAYEQNLVDMVTAARAAGAQVVLLNFWTPWGLQVAYREAFERARERTGAPEVAYTGERVDPIHPTREGYGELAADVAAELRRAGYLREPDAAAQDPR